ncbi:MAG TPA: tetratricopeptide repeat protein [Tepidisphaeraceae bacterium]|jgi:TolA-binding protein|nr:tetratricopeptide repeat protein [Tepidisphaeraceae bacterium]
MRNRNHKSFTSQSISCSPRACSGFLLILSVVFFTGCNADNTTKENLTAGYQALDARQFDEAMQHANQQLQQSPSGPGSAEALYLKGRALEQNTVAPDQVKSTRQAARDAYQKALQQDPAPDLQRLLHAGIANTSYFLDDYTTALEEWSAAYPSFDDPIVRSFMLYRIGLCQQRLGQFAQADQTFANVQQQYPGTDAATRSHEHQGFHSFTLQLATFANSRTADNTLDALRRQGMMPTKAVNAQGNTVVSIGPIPSYQQALDLKTRFLPAYPQAIILP